MFNIKWRVVVARTLIIVLAGNPLIMAAHGIENAQLAAGQQAAMKRSANGTEVIDIVAPSKKGVSHNKFTQFNVTPDGLILNNSQGPAMSAIGGWTDGNRRLAGGTASLILAEVTSNKRSSLRGYTEVLGDSAEFVLANPNGISCNGCGFINTPRVMLATGTPDLMNGNLMGIDVTGGDVSIDGAGLNASNVDKFDILTRAMRLNAALYANELNIRTGSNYYNFDTLQSRKSSNNPDNSADFEFALDASSLGAMYANRISLIGTEAGLGVRSKGLITSTDSMQLTADGQLELKNTIAGGDLALRSKNADVITHGTTYGKDVNIKLADTLHNNGIIAAADSMDITAAELQQNGNLIAGLSQQGEWLAGASQQLNVSGTLVNRGRIISQGQQTLSAKQLKNISGALLQANETTLNTKKLANSGVLNSNALTIKTETAQNAGHIQAQELAIDAKQFKQTQGVVYQAGPNGHLSFAGNNLQLDGGVLVADGDSQINASDSIRNKGTLLTAGDASITTKKLQNTGRMTAGQLNIDASTVTNDSDALIEATQAKLNTESLHNAGTLLATGEQGDSLLLQTDELTNRGRIESHGENLTLNNVELDNRQGEIYQHGDGALQLNFLGDLRNNGGEVYSAGQLNITGGDVDNTGGALTALESLKLKGSGISNNAGVMASDGLLDINADNIDNTSGALQANAIQLNSLKDLNNSDGAINGQTVDLRAGTLENTSGVILATDTTGDALQLNNFGLLNNNGGNIASAGNLLLSAEQVNNDGRISAENNLELNATKLNNSQLLFGRNNASVNAETINNSGTLTATQLTASDFGLLQNSGRIESDSASYTGDTLDNLGGGVLINAGSGANSLELNVAGLNNAGTVHNSSQNMNLGGNLTNSGSIIHAGSGDLVLGSNGSIQNANGSIASAGTAKLKNSVTGAGTLYATQGMELASSGTFVNNSQLYTKGNILVNSALDNQGGSLLSDGNLTINTSDNVTNSGTLQGQNLDLKAGALNNNAGVITSTGNESAQIDAASLSNNGGVIQSTNDKFTINTRIGELDNSNGQISHNGSNLTLDSASHLNQQSGVVQSTGQLAVNAEANLNNTGGVLTGSQYQLNSSGSLKNNSGRIVGSGSGASSIESGALVNRSGYIAANGNNLTLNTAALDNNAGSILLAGTGNLDITASSVASDAASSRIISNGAINLNGGTELKNAGQISSAKQLSLNAKTLSNSGTLASRAGKVDIDSTGTLTNSGTVSGAKAVDLDVRTLNNRNGKVQSDGTVAINVNSLNVGHIQARNITLDSNNSIALQSNESISAGGNIDLDTNANINNSGTIVASGTLTADAKELTNKASGLIRSGGNAILDANKLTNNGTVSSNSVLKLDVANTSNTGTLAAGTQLDINGNINNSNLLFASNLLTVDGNVSNTGNIYSNRDAAIKGTTVTNTGGSIAAARDLSISGKILNTYTGDFSYTADSPTTTSSYPDGNPHFYSDDYYDRVRSWTTTKEFRTSRVYRADLNGKAGVIAAGGNLGLNGNITNNFGTISAVGNLVLSGSNLTNNSAKSRKETEVTLITEHWENICLRGYSGSNGYHCTEPGDPKKLDESVTGTYDETTYIEGENYGTITAGNISGNLSGSIELNDVTPSDVNGKNVNTKASGSRGSASRGSSASNNNDTKVVVLRTDGNSENITEAERLADAGNATMPADNAELIKTSSPNKLGANTSGPGVQGVGFMTPDMADSLRMSQGIAPEAPGVQQGVGAVGNGNIANESDYNPDLIIKGLVDDQKGTLAQQKGSVQQQESIQQQKNAQQQAAGQRAGQNVFMTDEQMRVLTEDLGFDADVINKGQEGLYSAISQNDLLEDGVTLSATGVIDITADAGLNIDSGIAAGEGLILRSEGGLNMGDYGHFDSDNLLGLQLGGDFTNDMSLESDTLWFDIGGDFTNQGELTGNNVLSINAGDDLINQSLLSGGNVVLNAGGDIVNRTEFNQHTYERNNGNSGTYTIVGDSPEIISGESLSMNAGNNLDLQGSQLGAAGDISLHAGNDVLLNAVEKVNGHERYFKGGYDIELDRTYDVVSLEAGGNLSVVAGNNLESEGAQFGAGGVAALAAGNEMNLMAVVESHYDADKKTKKSFLKKKVTETVSHHEEVQGTAITAENILLNATVDSSGQVVEQGGGDITLEGGELNASENIIGFGEDITLTAGTYQDYEYSHTSKSSFGGLKSSSREDLAQDDLLDGSTLSAGGNILLNAGNNLNILASQLDGDNIGLTAFNDVLIASGEESSIRESRSKSGGFFSGGSLFSSTEALTGSASITADSSVIDASGNIVIDAGSATVIGSSLDADEGIAVKTDIGDIQVLAAKETEQHYEYRKEMDVGFGDVLDAMSDPAGLLKNTYDKSKDSGRASLTIANADYLESETNVDITRHKGSEITAGTDVTFDSINNINIEGSNIHADTDGDSDGALSLKAGNDIRVADVTDTYSENNKTTEGSAEVSVMVTHQAAEMANAAVAVKDAAEQLKDTRRNYKAWQQQQDTLKAQLTKLEGELAQGAPGVTQADVDDLRTQIDILGTDEEWHLANIAVATTNLATATTNLTGQSLTSAASSTTWGFNGGLELDINASVTESQTRESTSVGSNLSGSGVYIETGEDGELAVAGSAVSSTDDMVLDVGSLDMQAGVSTHDSRTQYKQGNINVSQTVWGAAAGGPSISGSLSLGEQRDHSTTHTNASLTADGHMDMTVHDDATLVGATVHANEGLTASIGGDLTLESVQDLAYGSNQGAGISGGMSFGGVYTNEGGAGADPEQVTLTTARGQDEASGANAGANTSKGRYYNKETVLSSITSGGEVDITVDGHTDLTGSVIASIDENGNDTGDLNLTTGSLDFTDLTDTHYSTDSSVSLNTNVLLGENTTPPPKGVTTQPQDSKGDDQPSGTTNLGLHDSSSYGKDKTLATVGEGNITVGGEEADPEGLNRDTDSTDKELYSVDRTKADLDVTVDNQTLAEVADAVVAAKREIQTWGDQAPEEIQAFIPGIENFIEDQIINGKDVDGLLNAVKSEEFKEAAEKLQPLVDLVQNNPELLEEALEAGKEIRPDQIVKNADGVETIVVTGNRGIPVKTEVLHAMGIMNEAVEAVMESESGQMVQLLGAALGGLPRLVASTAVDQIAGDELAELQQNAAVAIGAWGTDRSSGEFSEDVADEQIYKHSEFYQTVEGGASLSMNLAAILITGKVVSGKKGVIKASETIGRPVEAVIGNKKRLLRVDIEPNGKLQIQSGSGKKSIVDFRPDLSKPLAPQINKQFKRLPQSSRNQLIKNAEKGLKRLQDTGNM
ncbi:hemagglutinin repeat-containing protein [Idiomarina sp.]|uniref:two-partner secretion domain-containing protein n=1 Tax=Idiomarina sp. TaxID=1874361 RepID=UPI003A90C6E8